MHYHIRACFKISISMNLGQLFAKFVQFLLQWGAFGFGFGHFGADLAWKNACYLSNSGGKNVWKLANFGVESSSHHNRLGFACSHIGSLRPMSIKSHDKHTVIIVFTENSRFFLSWLTARGSGMASVCLMTDTLSPKPRFYIMHHRTFYLW